MAAIPGTRRGRPRSERARTAILEAATELLLVKTLPEITMDAIAERASVSKATIYRWWRSKELLALDALYHEWETVTQQGRDTGSLRGDLLSLLRPWVKRAEGRSLAHVVAAMIIEVHANPAFGAEYQARFVAPRRVPGLMALNRAIERGELPPDTNVDLALDLLYGPLYHRLLHRHARLTPRYVEQIVDAAIAALTVD
jgi:AcrR family transcriptional regulator